MGYMELDINDPDVCEAIYTALTQVGTYGTASWLERATAIRHREQEKLEQEKVERIAGRMRENCHPHIRPEWESLAEPFRANWIRYARGAIKAVEMEDQCD